MILDWLEADSSFEGDLWISQNRIRSNNHIHIVPIQLAMIRTDEEIQEMIDEADRNHDGQIDPDEFFRIMKKRSDNPLDDWDSDED